jgi:hypothetical protein
MGGRRYPHSSRLGWNGIDAAVSEEPRLFHEHAFMPGIDRRTSDASEPHYHAEQDLHSTPDCSLHVPSSVLVE